MNIRLALIVAVTLSVGAQASSHREAPFITKYPQVDATDFYTFMSYQPGREDYVTLIANYLPLQAAYGGPNYFPLDSEALYEIHVDNDGDANEDLTFQFRFSDMLPFDDAVPTIDVDGVPITSVLRNLSVVLPDIEPGLVHAESYTVTLVTGDRRTGAAQPVTRSGSTETSFRKPFDYSGTKTFGGPRDYDNYARRFVHDIDVPGCAQPGRVFVGQRNEAFKLALGEVFDLINLVPIDGDSAPGAGDGGGFPGGVTQDASRNQLARNNVTSLALELHKDCLNGDDAVIGAWTSASLRQATILNPSPTFERPEVAGGAMVQVSRLASPLVNELVIGYDMKDRFNSSHPRDDAQFLKFVTNPQLPVILDQLFRSPVNDALGTDFANLAPTNFPRGDLVAAFLTGVDGLNQFASATPAEMLRLNMDIAPTPRDEQSPLGVAGGDLAGYPNGRRPGDDAVDISLRAVMGVLCHLGVGLCDPEDAPTGMTAYTDGAPLSATDLGNTFPYLLTPYPGSPVGAPLPNAV